MFRMAAVVRSGLSRVRDVVKIGIGSYAAKVQSHYSDESLTETYNKK